MKKLLFVLFVLPATISHSQMIGVHVMGGFANYNGDIQQRKITLDQAKSAISVGGTIEITDQLALRGDYSFARLRGDDKKNKRADLRERNLNFETIIQELAMVAEYDIFNLNQRKLSPYVFGGIGLFHFSPYTYDAAGTKYFLGGLGTEGQGIIPGRDVYKRTQFNFPIGGGIKYALSDDIRIGFELGLRVLKTDYLDDVSTTYIDENRLLAGKGPKTVELAFRGDELKVNPKPYPAEGTQRGNSNANDFYYFGMFRLDFRLNWFDKEGSRTDKTLRCPAKL